MTDKNLEFAQRIVALVKEVYGINGDVVPGTEKVLLDISRSDFDTERDPLSTRYKWAMLRQKTLSTEYTLTIKFYVEEDLNEH